MKQNKINIKAVENAMLEDSEELISRGIHVERPMATQEVREEELQSIEFGNSSGGGSTYHFGGWSTPNWNEGNGD